MQDHPNDFVVSLSKLNNPVLNLLMLASIKYGLS